MTATPPASADADKIVVLFSAETADGKPFHCYIKMTLEKFSAYAETLRRPSDPSQKIDLTSLGEIVAKGWGTAPSPEFHQAVIARYGPVHQS